MRYPGKHVSWPSTGGRREGVVVARAGDHCKIKVLQADGGFRLTRVNVDRLTVLPCENLVGYLHETIDTMSAEQVRKTVRYVNQEVL